MKNPAWASKVREWRTRLETSLDPHFRDKAKSVAIVHDFREDMGLDAGRYIYATGTFHEIRMSAFMTEEEASSTYGHEYAHFLACFFYGDQTHGFIWKSFMSMFGLAAAQFHTIPLGARCVIEQIKGKIDQTGKPE